MISKINSKIVSQLLNRPESPDKTLLETIRKSQNSHNKVNEAKKYGGLDFNFQEEVSDVTHEKVSPVQSIDSLPDLNAEKSRDIRVDRSQSKNKEVKSISRIENIKMIEDYYKPKKIDETINLKSKTFLTSKKQSNTSANINIDNELVSIGSKDISIINNQGCIKEEAGLKQENLICKEELLINHSQISNVRREEELKINIIPVDAESKINLKFNIPNNEKKEGKSSSVLNVQIKENEDIRLETDEIDESEIKTRKKILEIKAIHSKNSSKMKEKHKITELVNKPKKRSETSKGVLQKPQIDIIENTEKVDLPFEENKLSSLNNKEKSVIKKTEIKSNINEKSRKKSKKMKLIAIDDPHAQTISTKKNKINLSFNEEDSESVLKFNNQIIINEKGMKLNKPLEKNCKLNKNKEEQIIINKGDKLESSKPSRMKNYDPSKFKQYDIQNLAYQALSDYESEKRIIKDEEFLARMDKDVESRLIKEDKIMSIITIKKGKLKEEERLKTFNRLISDANRRLEDINKTKEITKQEEYERILREKSKKRYKEKDWEEIYEERFEKYQEEKNKKLKEKRMKKKSKEKELEEKIVQRIRTTQKYSDKEIEKSSKRLSQHEVEKRKNNLANLNKKFHFDDYGEKIVKTKISSKERYFNSESDIISNYYSDKSISNFINLTKSNKQSTSNIKIEKRTQLDVNVSPRKSKCFIDNRKSIIKTNQSISIKGKLHKKLIRCKKKNQSTQPINFKPKINLINSPIELSDNCSIITNDFKSIKDSVHKPLKSKNKFIPEFEVNTLVDKIIKSRELLS